MEYITFVESSEFDKKRDKLFQSDEEFRFFEDGLVQNPTRGIVLKETIGVRKVRWGLQAQAAGKSGGIRVYYLYVQSESRIYLLDGFAKNKTASPTHQQLMKINAIAKRERG